MSDAMSNNLSDTNAENLLQKAISFHERGELNHAAACYRECLKQNPNNSAVLSNLGILHYQQGHYQRALQYLYRALSFQPHDGNAYNNLGLTYKALKMPEQALHLYYLCSLYSPDHSEVWKNIASLYGDKRDYQRAVETLQTHVSHYPDDAYAWSAIIHYSQQIMAWEGLEESVQKLLKFTEQGQAAVDNFALLFLCDSPDILHRAAVQSGRGLRQKYPLLGPTKPRPHRDKIRLAYVNNDVNWHPVALQTNHLYLNHNRDEFEVYVYTITSVEDTLLSQFIRSRSDKFTNLAEVEDLAAYQAIAEDAPDIVIDLVGYTKGQRPGILARKPAPKIISYLGYIGTMGTDYHDYIIADKYVIPEASQKYYSEKVLYVDCLYAHQKTHDVIGEMTKRSDHNLPEKGFIFCSFNQIAKINKRVFDTWMKILQQCEDSYLWLIHHNDYVPERLREHAASYGIAPERLLFADMTVPSILLARYFAADLALDTFPYNGGLTSMDALYSHCPLLTLPGQTMISRVGASLLTHLGQSALIADNSEDYIQKACHLAHHPEQLRSIRTAIQQATQTAPLFDGVNMTRQLEAHYRNIVNNQ